MLCSMMCIWHCFISMCNVSPFFAGSQLLASRIYCVVVWFRCLCCVMWCVCDLFPYPFRHVTVYVVSACGAVSHLLKVENGWPWHHSRSQLSDKSKTTVSIFSEISQSIWIKLIMLPQSVGLLMFMLDVFCASYIPGRVLCWGDFIKHCSLSGHLNTNLFPTWYDTRHD